MKAHPETGERTIHGMWGCESSRPGVPMAKDVKAGAEAEFVGPGGAFRVSYGYEKRHYARGYGDTPRANWHVNQYAPRRERVRKPFVEVWSYWRNEEDFAKFGDAVAYARKRAAEASADWPPPPGAMTEIPVPVRKPGRCDACQANFDNIDRHNARRHSETP
jgi:hypothetical protein